MTDIKFIKQDDLYIGILCEGHTGYAEYGKDIVCASVSSIVGALSLGITKVLGVNVSEHKDDDRGYLELRLSKKTSKENVVKCQVLFETALVALIDLQSGYPSNINVEV